jgi:predicted transcriptional regulator
MVVPVGFSRNENLPGALNRECRYGAFLGNVASSSEYWLRHYANESGFHKERGLLSEIQWRATHYYHALWECLSFEEQLLIYNLATDQLANCGAATSLNRLTKKGLIVRNNAGRLVLFNKSFALHVNTAISKEDTQKIKSHVKATGTWDVIKVPLLLSAGAVLVFLVGSNQHLLQQTEQQLAAYAAAGALLMKMLGYFGRPFSNN